MAKRSEGRQASRDVAISKHQGVAPSPAASDASEGHKIGRKLLDYRKWNLSGNTHGGEIRNPNLGRQFK